MFEKALVTRAGPSIGIDLGLLAETVFFYGSTHLLFTRGSLVDLAARLPADDLLAFLDRAEVRVSYLREGFGVITSGAIRASSFTSMTYQGQTKGKRFDHRDEIEEFLFRRLGRSTETRRLAKELVKRVKLYKFSGHERANVVPSLATRDIRDADFLRAAAQVVLEHKLPAHAVPKRFLFKLVDTGMGFMIDTDLKYERLNAEYHKIVPKEHSSINSDSILACILDSRAESYFAADYMAELVTIPVYSNLIRLKHFDFVRRKEKSEAEVELFREVVLPDFPTIRDVINDGTQSVSDFLRLLDKADKFKAWLQAINPDQGLLREYHVKATEDTWADALPVKSLRFVIATGLGWVADAVIGSGSGAAVGALDSFYVDRLLKGWRPSQFIDGPYREFVTKEGGR